MPVPTFDKFIDPLIRFLVRNPDGVHTRDAYEAVADVLTLTDIDRAELLERHASNLQESSRLGP